MRLSWTDGKVTGTTVIARDQTERLRTETALRESEEKFRALTEQSPSIVLIARLDRIVYANPMLSKVTGYSGQELLDMRLTEFVHADYRELVLDRHRRRLKGEEVPSRYEIKVVTKDGDERWLDISAQLIDFEGAPAALVACVDVSARKAAEEQLRQKEWQLAHVSRLSTLGEMVAGIAHEVNQPLSAIANFAQAAKNVIQAEDYGFDAPVERWLGSVHDQAVRCGDIIRRLRHFVKQGDHSRERTDLNCVVRESVALLESDLRHRRVEIDYQLPQEELPAHVNQIELQQVIVNLLRNALMPPVKHQHRESDFTRDNWMTTFA